MSDDTGTSSGGNDRSIEVPLEAEAASIVELFNDAKADYAPELEWFAMRSDPDTGQEYFALEAERYLDSEGIQTLREHERYIKSVAAGGIDEDVVTIEIAVENELPSTDTDRSEASDQ